MALWSMSKNGKIVVLGALILLGLLAGVYFKSSFFPKVRESHYKALIMVPVTVQKVYFESNQTFLTDPVEFRKSFALGDAYQGESIKMYLVQSEVPEDLIKLIPEARLPFLDKSSYRLLFIVEKPEKSAVEAWTADETKAIQKIDL